MTLSQALNLLAPLDQAGGADPHGGGIVINSEAQLAELLASLEDD